MKVSELFTVLIIASICGSGICELFTIGVSLGVVSVGTYFYSQYENWKCVYTECCTDKYIHLNLPGLNHWLSENLYGQKIAQNTILRALHGHVSNKSPSKPLVMSFHGPPGTGKNYAATNIANNLYERGNNSQYYHFFNGRDSFPSEKMLDEYKETLRAEILMALFTCGKSMFVFDEVDKMPEGILDVLVPFLDYSPHISIGYNDKLAVTKMLNPHQRIHKNHAIFIFLSNTGSSQIIQTLMELWESGKKREETKLQDFENLIAIGAFNEKGGLRQSDTIQRNLIDHYVPFLPLEEVHVKKCLRKMFTQILNKVSDEMIAEGMTHVTFGPPPHNLYSKSGCKRLEQKVATIVYKHDKHKIY